MLIECGKYVICGRTPTPGNDQVDWFTTWRDNFADGGDILDIALDNGEVLKVLFFINVLFFEHDEEFCFISDDWWRVLDKSCR